MPQQMNARRKSFGYNPIFKPEDYKHTFTEIDLEQKNKIGHRGLGVKQLVNFLKKTLS